MSEFSAWEIHFKSWIRVEEESGGRGEVEFVEEPETSFAEVVAALGKLEVVLGAEEAVDAVADHGALAHEEAALAQDFLSLAGGLGGDVNLADHAGVQKSGEDVGVDVASLRSPFGLPSAGCLPSVGCRF